MWDTVVFDMPASGHSISMLRMPWVIVDTVPEGPLTRDARTVKELLSDPKRTAAVLVTLAEEMPVNEAIELEAKLTALGIVPQHVVCNQIYPKHFPAGSPVDKVLDALVAEPALALAARRGHAARPAVARSQAPQRALSRRAAHAREGAGARAADHVRADADAGAREVARRHAREELHRRSRASGTAARRGSRGDRRCSRSRRRSSCRRARRARASRAS